MKWHNVRTFENWTPDFAGKEFVYRLRYIGKDYIGSTENAWNRFRKWRSILKGVEARMQVLCICPNKDYRFALEARAILAYDTFNNGHNCTRTGQGGGTKNLVWTDKMREQARIRGLGYVPTEETRRKISLAGMGKTNAKGPRTEESKLRMSIAAKNRKMERTEKICPWCGEFFMGHSRMKFCEKPCTRAFNNFYFNSLKAST